MKKAILPILALSPFLFFSCNSKKQSQEPIPLANKTQPVEKSAESQSFVGKWKMVVWNDPTTILSDADKQKVMDATEIELTSDGKWITRAEGKENVVNYSYYDNTRTLTIPGDDGQMESLRVSFAGNQMTLAGDKGSVVLERL